MVNNREIPVIQTPRNQHPQHNTQRQMDPRTKAGNGVKIQNMVHNREIPVSQDGVTDSLAKQKDFKTRTLNQETQIRL